MIDFFLCINATIILDGLLPDDEDGVDEDGDARFTFRLQQQQHKTNKSTRTKKMPPAAAPIIIARLSSSFLPPGNGS